MGIFNPPLVDAVRVVLAGRIRPLLHDQAIYVRQRAADRGRAEIQRMPLLFFILSKPVSLRPFRSGNLASKMAQKQKAPHAG